MPSPLLRMLRVANRFGIFAASPAAGGIEPIQIMLAGQAKLIVFVRLYLDDVIRIFQLREPDNPEFLINLGSMLAETGQLEESMAFVGKALFGMIGIFGAYAVANMLSGALGYFWAKTNAHRLCEIRASTGT